MQVLRYKVIYLIAILINGGCIFSLTKSDYSAAISQSIVSVILIILAKVIQFIEKRNFALKKCAFFYDLIEFIYPY